MAVSLWMTVTIGIIALLAGFWLGRSIRWMVAETEEQLEDLGMETLVDGETEVESEMNNTKSIMRNGGKKIKPGKAIASPVSGTVRSFCEGSSCGAVLQPDNGQVFAPASGRITRLYPMGTAMLLTTDLGTELMLKMGSSDELCSMYYRARVMQNEIVDKGKLILEFDKEELERRGMDVTLSISVENMNDNRNISVTSKERIKAGEDLLWLV